MKWLFLSGLLFLGACSAAPQPAPVQVHIQQPPEPVKPDLQHVNFKIIHLGNREYYSLDQNNITILFSNLNELQKYITNQSSLIHFYEQQMNK